MTEVARIKTERVDKGRPPLVKSAPISVPPRPVADDRPPVPRVDRKDPRYLALRNFAISTSVFNVLGYTVLGFEQPWLWPILALAVGYTAEIAIGVVSAWATFAPPYEFTENVPDLFRIFIPMIIITAGTVLNAMLTKKVPLIVGWAGGFAIQALLRHYIWGVALWSALAVMIGVAFVLFTNYMITDPGTTPSSGMNQFMFGSSVAMGYGVLMLFNVVYTLFFAVCIVCLARGMYHWARWLVDRRRTATVTPGAAVHTTPALEVAVR